MNLTESWKKVWTYFRIEKVGAYLDTSCVKLWWYSPRFLKKINLARLAKNAEIAGMQRVNMTTVNKIPIAFFSANPESFVRGGPVLFCLWEVGWSKYHYKRVIIGPPAIRHLNGVSLACRWWSKIECWLGSFVIFQGIETIIAKKPYKFAIFQWGSGHPVPPSGSTHAVWH